MERVTIMNITKLALVALLPLSISSCVVEPVRARPVYVAQPAYVVRPAPLVVRERPVYVIP